MVVVVIRLTSAFPGCVLVGYTKNSIKQECVQFHNYIGLMFGSLLYSVRQESQKRFKCTNIDSICFNIGYHIHLHHSKLFVVHGVWFRYLPISVLLHYLWYYCTYVMHTVKFKQIIYTSQSHKHMHSHTHTHTISTQIPNLFLLTLNTESPYLSA